jgi:hypothetical protein
MDLRAGDTEAVKVFVRVRPESYGYSTSRHVGDSDNGKSHLQVTKCVTIKDDKTIRLTPPDDIHGTRKPVAAVDDKTFSFDKIFSEASTQEEVYSCVSPLVQATVRGYNTTVFAYGCTGSGKSFSMTGSQADLGIIPRAISEVFEIVERTTSHQKDVFFYVRISYVELYNNTFRNLLEAVVKDQINSSSARLSDTSFVRDESFEGDAEHSRTGMSDKIEVREDPKSGVFLAGPNLRLL